MIYMIMEIILGLEIRMLKESGILLIIQLNQPTLLEVFYIMDLEEGLFKLIKMMTI